MQQGILKTFKTCIWEPLCYQNCIVCTNCDLEYMLSDGHEGHRDGIMEYICS